MEINLSKVKRHMKVHYDLDDNDSNIEDYIRQAKNRVNKLAGISKGHEKEFIKNNVDYEQAVLYLVQLYYKNPTPTMESKNSTFFEYGLDESINSLIIEYSIWVDKYEN